MADTASRTGPPAASTPAPQSSAPATEPYVLRLVLGFAAFVVLAAVIGILLAGPAYTPSPQGLPDAGPLVGWAVPLINGLVFVTAICTIGWLLLAAFLDPDARDKHVSRRGRRALLRAGAASLLWFLFAIGAALFALADVLGAPLSEALRPSTISTYAWDITTVRALIISAALALAIAIGTVFTARLTTATWWLVLAIVAICAPSFTGHAAGLGNHAVALVSGIAHVTSATVWVGGLLALGLLAFTVRAGRPGAGGADGSPSTLRIAASRFSPLAMACVAALLASGILNAYARIGDVADLVYTGYGQVVLLKSLLLIGLVGLGLQMRRRVLPDLAGPSPRRAFARLAAIEVAMMAVATGLGVALAASAPPRSEVRFATAGEAVLGSQFPPAPDVWRILLGWNFDPLFLAVGVVGSAFYIAGVMRLHARGDKWPVARTVSFLLGMGLLIWATNAGIAAYSNVSVGIHMIQHMTLVMLVPIPIVLGGPITLALRAIHPSPNGGRGPRELLTATLHSKVAEIYTNPLIVLAIYATGVYGLYFTGLFGFLMGSHIGHILMTIHFLVTGLLLSYVVIGIDPQPKPIPYWARLVLVLATVVLHTFFAIAFMSTATPIGAEWYGVVQPPWLTDAVADSQMGGSVAWGAGELPTVLMMLIIAVQWRKSDLREAKRRDRYTSANGDVELDSYNEYLAHLQEVNEKYELRRQRKGAPTEARPDSDAQAPPSGPAARP